MKELSIEEKAKRYDEALEKAKKLYEQGTITESLSYIFPELKESLDERIRRNIIAALKGEGYYDCDLTNECIAWLEKQGDQKSVDKEYTFKSIPRLLDMIEPTDRAKSYCKKLIDSLQTEGYSVDAKIVGECLKQMNGEKVAMATMDIEKQGEHPRYSIGDVLCDKSCTTLNKDTQPNFEIIDIKNGMYICDKGSFPISQQDEYELVAKKIDQTSQSMVSAEAKEALYDKPTDEEMKELLRTEYEKGRADTIAEIKSSWSEVDDIRLQACIDCLQAKSLMGKVDTVMTNWLKSFKDRYTWKPSEEQIQCLHDAIEHYQTNGYPASKLNELYEQMSKIYKL